MIYKLSQRLVQTTMLCVGIMAGSAAWAQGATLEPGFGYQTASGEVTGNVDASIFGSSVDEVCAGYVADRPTFTMVLTEDMPRLQVRLDAYGYFVGLVVHSAQGRRCSGPPVFDRATLDGPWEAGRYNIYIASANQWDYVYYNLYFDELASPVVAPVEALTTGYITLDSAFTRFSATNTASEATALRSECGGAYTSIVALEITVSEGVAHPIAISTSLPADAVFVVEGPAHTPLVHCGSAGSPVRMRPDAGQYTVHVGRSVATTTPFEFALTVELETP